MELAIFDLDNTLLDGDSDYLWGQFLCENNYISCKEHEDESTKHYKNYQQGTLDIHAFLKFQLRCLAENDYATLHAWRERFLKEKIQPVILPKATQLIEQHRCRGHTLLIITATNDFITTPIAKLLHIDNLIATKAQIEENKYTGEVSGIPSFAEGKVILYKEWLKINKFIPQNSFFYSDSHNDIPLLSYVTHPVVVDPDKILKNKAKQNNWKIISLR